MLPVGVVTLRDDVVTLEPLAPEHAVGLLQAATGRRDTFGLTYVPATADAMRAYLEAAFAEASRGVSLPFATRDSKTGRVVGSTRFMNIERWTWVDGSALQRSPEYADAVEIGSTWLAPEAQRTGINTHAKLLMLTHAFDAWEVRRVTLKTDARNVRSRAAIERIGGRLDGILRAHMPAADGTERDTALYSILRTEWPAVRERLRAMAHGR